tara:strand:+ start:105 stop:482 length:378 start_codon:yes stop_codon:yes gene_type:complete
MFETFIFNAEHGQILCITHEKKQLSINLIDFTPFIPFQWSKSLTIFLDDSLKELFLEVLNELYNDNKTKRLFKAKKYNIHYIYKGMNKVVSYDSWNDARRQHIKMVGYGDLYSSIFPDFNTEIND